MLAMLAYVCKQPYVIKAQVWCVSSDSVSLHYVRSLVGDTRRGIAATYAAR